MEEADSAASLVEEMRRRLGIEELDIVDHRRLLFTFFRNRSKFQLQGKRPLAECRLV